jgi:hypothetical protein
MNEVLTCGQPAMPYTKFRTALGGDPSAAECERWAAQHPGDPEEPSALVDAGWATVRSGGHGERALALFRRAAEFGGEFGRDGQVGVIDCLYTAGHEAEADTAERALRLEVSSLPGEWRSVAHPEQTLFWPPPRNGPCWCDSGRKYKKCCGSPAKN